MKFGIILYVILGIMSSIVGYSLIKSSQLFSIIFFITSIALITIAHIEYKYDKNNKIVLNQDDEIPEEINVKYFKSNIVINILKYCIFIILSIFLLNLFNKKYKEIDSNYFFISIITIIGISFCLIKIILEIKKLSQILISINNMGIKLKNNPRIKWKEISLEKITTRYISNPTSKYDNRNEINSLHFFHNNEKIEINIDDFDITDYQLSQVLKIFRTRHNNSSL